jgi:molybdopterin synthase catalytic subunit
MTYMNIVMNYLIEGPVTIEIISEYIDKTDELSVAGGHSLFLGQVRPDEVKGKKVRAIEYSAYDGMVRAVADKIKKDVLSQFPDVLAINILHSTGMVSAGQISLFVLVSAGHREQAMKACTAVVELLKEKLPVWKKEIFEDNTYEWK